MRKKTIDTIPDLTEEIKSILIFFSRSRTMPASLTNRASIFTQEQIIKIVDLACKASSDLGYEVSQWGLNLLVKEIRRQGIAEDISAKSVSRFLKGGQIKTP